MIIESKRWRLMDSRTNRYYEELDHEVVSSTRSSRNKRLYMEVNGGYSDLENLPILDNTDEIDMARLKELVLDKEKKEESVSRKVNNFNIDLPRKRNIDDEKVYDINKILEKAKYENDKLKENTTSVPKVNKQILNTLQSTELSLDAIKKASLPYQSSSKETDTHQEKDTNQLEEKLGMTRELKYQNLMNDNQEENNEIKAQKESELSLDLFSDLKPTGNTIVTKPIKDRDEEGQQIKPEIRSEDTRDIDIIKNVSGNESKENSNDFFTSSYEFSKKDFMAVDDDFSDLDKHGSILKIILLFLLIFVVGGVIAYFVLNYGIGVS